MEAREVVACLCGPGELGDQSPWQPGGLHTSVIRRTASPLPTRQLGCVFPGPRPEAPLAGAGGRVGGADAAWPAPRFPGSEPALRDGLVSPVGLGRPLRADCAASRRAASAMGPLGRWGRCTDGVLRLGLAGQPAAAGVVQAAPASVPVSVSAGSALSAGLACPLSPSAHHNGSGAAGFSQSACRPAGFRVLDS